MSRWTTIVAVLALGCSSKAVPQNDARALAKSLDQLREVAGQDNQTRLLYGACSEIPSCAGDCQRALQACALPGTDSAQRGAILADCFTDFKSEHASKQMPADVWIRKYITMYAQRAKEGLPPDEKSRIDASLAALQLPQ